jgi:PIN domain nuclease of toxin-antitoxin system
VILLDTCALLWLESDRKAFSARAMEHLRSNYDALAISPISFHEVGIKQSKKRLSLPMPLAKWSAAMIEKYGLSVLPVTTDVAVTAAILPRIHNDPFDHLIIATARVNKLGIVTADTRFTDYPKVKVIW